MAIGGLIRGYKRWNPVHPTYGAFWGFGVGVGCGVGWGPGFGPEVVGFVGSGCGVGFSMGVTLVGVGIGLPASGVACLPCKVVTGAGQRVSQMTTLVLPIVSTLAAQTWQSMGTQISQLRSKHQNTEEKSPIAFPDDESSDGLSQVRFSSSSSAALSPQQDSAHGE